MLLNDRQFCFLQTSVSKSTDHPIYSGHLELYLQVLTQNKLESFYEVDKIVIRNYNETKANKQLAVA